MAALLGIEKEGGDGSYLGLPEYFSGSKQKLLAFIGERLDKRLNGWFTKMLSLGGKEVLLKSVALTLPVYAMSCFKLSKFQCQKITSAMSSFWWNVCDKKINIHWVSWKKMCKSKDNGGIGFQDIGDFNQALLAKQAWRILNEPDALLSLLYKGRYFSANEFLDCGKGYRPSYAWRSINFGRNLLKRGLLKSVGNGETTWVWLEKWMLDTHPRVPSNLQRSIDLNLRVSNLITSDGRWDITLLNELFPPEDVKRIMKMTHGNVNDRYIWAYNDNGSYSVKSGY